MCEPKKFFKFYTAVLFKVDPLYLFMQNNLAYNEEKYIGMANTHYWIYENFHMLIDEGGTYRQMNPIEADGKAPIHSQESGIKEHSMNMEMIKDIYRHTVHPEFIRFLAQKFINKYLSGPEKFLGVHWRFDKEFLPSKAVFDAAKISGDRSKTNGKGIPQDIREMFYETIENPIYFLDKLISHSTNNQVFDDPKNNYIFISSPQSVAKQFQSLNSSYYHKQTNQTFNIISSMDSHHFLLNYAKDNNCDIIIDYFGDILSTFEKEILIYSMSFYRARPSNWSFNVQGQRFAREMDLSMDRVIFDVFLERDR